MTRKALLVANSVGYGGHSEAVTRRIATIYAKSLASELEGLADRRFDTAKLVDMHVEDARTAIRKAVVGASRSGQLMLIYYFGHAVVHERTNDLYFFFRDSDVRDYTTLINITEILSPLATAERKLILILDCCYAGIAEQNLRVLDRYGASYYLMASTAPSQLAYLDHSRRMPFGTFSKHLLAGFSARQACVLQSRAVTFRSIFSYAASETQKEGYQQPVGTGLLADEEFFIQASATDVPNALNTSAPRKSTYTKLFALLGYVSARGWSSGDVLYNSLVRRPPKAFLTPKKNHPNGRDVQYVMMGRSAFLRYIHLAELLGMVAEDRRLELTPLGKRMLRTEGRQFNKLLHVSLQDLWKRYEVEHKDLESAMSACLAGWSVPTRSNVYVALFAGRRVAPPGWLFDILLDLTGNSGALRLTREPTYFVRP